MPESGQCHSELWAATENRPDMRPGGGHGRAAGRADLRREGFCSTSPGPSQAPRRARKRAEGGASSNVFSMFDQSQIQEFKEVGQCP